MSRRLVLSLLLLAAPAFGAGVATAQDRPGLYLDPQQLPPDTRSGECVTRRVTGPGGAYRWDRVECEGDGGWSDFDRWGHGRPLNVENRTERGGRHGYEYRPGWGSGPNDRRYRVAGRDGDGFLVWPGKQP
ncbi:hypothetical protein [Caulobacter sp. DWR2-3-1b2]|uniref:hypothetical protein n=1 Tax=Caulobacter sp. DWR2-3-1b2 TaxID=2804642 RepID=UPI0019BB53C4|nr:hypothetical protein [Caulobacter sp.]